MENKKIIKKYVREELSKAPKLENFLKTHNSLGEFIKEFTKASLFELEHVTDFNETRNWISNKIQKATPIDTAFTWRNTQKGHAYWSKLNTEYKIKNSQNHWLNKDEIEYGRP